MDVKRDILWRVYLCFLAMAVLGITVLGRALYIQKLQGNYWRNVNDSQHQKVQELDADRGTIYSEDGQMLSTSLPQFDIYIDFKANGLVAKNGKVFRENIDSFATALSTFFNDKSTTQYKRELQAGYKRGSRYFSLKKKLSFAQYKAFRAFPLAKLERYKSGVIVEESSKRILPFGLLANRTIGLSREYIATDGKIKKQNVGLEKSYDTILAGKNGQRLIRYSAGTAIPIEGSVIEKENGKDIYTTLDVTMQEVTQNALLKMMQKSEAVHGTCIVMEVKTGKIKAIANLGHRSNDGSYWEDDNYALRVSEPGSTIKLATLLAVLDKGTSTLDEMINVGSSAAKQVGPRIVTDAETQPKAIQSVKECFVHSSNVGMSMTAYKAFGSNPEEFKKYISKFHLDKKSPIDLTDVPRPSMVPLAKKNGGVINLVTMSFGYAINVSPIHTLTLYNAVANNGKMMKPYLVNSIQNNGVVLQQFEPVVLENNIAKPTSIQAAQESLQAVTIEGTAKNAMKGISFPVAGKTGTAHVADKKIKYNDGVYQASFVGYFPANNPQYSCIVLIRTKPHAALHFGGSLAAPVFREVAEKIYALFVEQKTSTAYAPGKDSAAHFYAGNTTDIKNVFTALGMRYSDSVGQNAWTVVSTNNSNTILRANTTATKQMPDLKGMGLKDALYLLENLGTTVAVTGKGKVVEQSVLPGVSVKKGDKIKIVLN